MVRLETARQLDNRDGINRETINDAAKLIMHRLIAWHLARNPAILERARIANASAAEKFKDYPFVGEWDEILNLPPSVIRAKLASRSPAMTQLRSASPFVNAGIGLTDYNRRIRIGRAAKRIVARRLSKTSTAIANLA